MLLGARACYFHEVLKLDPLHAARHFSSISSLRIIMAPRFRFATKHLSHVFQFTFHLRKNCFFILECLLFFSLFFLLNHDSRFHFIYELYKRNFYRASLFPLFSSCLFDKSGLNELNNRKRSMLQRNSRED